jgi:hypothetical protein
MSMTATHPEEDFDIKRGMPLLAHRMLAVFAILAVLSLIIFAAGNLYGRSLTQAGHTTSIQRYEIVIGNDVLAVPANTIRSSEQRRQGIAKRVNLYLHWPTMSGFKPALADAFNDVSPETNSIVFISVTARATTRDMAGRFDAVYKNVIEGVAEDIAHGLKSHRLSRDHGYINEHIVYSVPDMRNGRRFVARCQDADSTEQLILAPCETDIHFGETLAAHVRFPARLLKDWQTLNAAVPSYVNGLLVRSDG